MCWEANGKESTNREGEREENENCVSRKLSDYVGKKKKKKKHFAVSIFFEGNKNMESVCLNLLNETHFLNRQKRLKIQFAKNDNTGSLFNSTLVLVLKLKI